MLNNGIALCPNLHRVFDRGLISISDDYRVLVSNSFSEYSDTPYSIKQFQNKQIILPDEEKYFPSIDNFRKHRERFIKKGIRY